MAPVTSADDLLSKGEKLFGKKTVPFNKHKQNSGCFYYGAPSVINF